MASKKSTYSRLNFIRTKKFPSRVASRKSRMATTTSRNASRKTPGSKVRILP